MVARIWTHVIRDAQTRDCLKAELSRHGLVIIPRYFKKEQFTFFLLDIFELVFIPSIIWDAETKWAV